MRSFLVTAVAVLLALSFVGTAQAGWFLDFEWGLGHDEEQVASGIPGLQFTTTGLYDWIYGDITTGAYNVTSDNGNVYGSANYFMSGNVYAWLGPEADVGRIDFLNNDGSWFTTGYCSISSFYLEAYDSNGNLLDSAVGAANTMTEGGTGLNYLSVYSPSNNISYVLLHDTGNYWLADNMSGDASGVNVPDIPEPATLVLLGMGLMGGAIARSRKRK